MNYLQNPQSILLQNIDVKDFYNRIGSMLDEKIDKILELQQNELQPFNNKATNLMTADELCNWLNISKITLWRHEKLGKLHPMKIGKRKVYDIEEVKESIAKSNLKD